MQPVLEIRNLRKSFGSEIVIDDLSLAVPVHTATVLIGASGSGKSTLLRCINLLETKSTPLDFAIRRCAVSKFVVPIAPIKPSTFNSCK